MIGIENFFDIGLKHYVFLGFFVFCVGLLILMMRKNISVLLMGPALLLTGVFVIAGSFSRYANSVEGVFLTIFIAIFMIINVFVGLEHLNFQTNLKKKEDQVVNDLEEDELALDSFQMDISIFIISTAVFISIIFFQ